MTRATAPCVFGEVLLDVFPDAQRLLGGAPVNVAWHLQAFGLGPRVVSRVGAGEAFAAAAIPGLVRGWPLPLLLARARAFAGQLVTRRGATIAEPAFHRTLDTDLSN